MINEKRARIAIGIAGVLGVLAVTALISPVRAEEHCPPHIAKAVAAIADKAKADPENEADYNDQIDRLLDIGDCRDLIPWMHIKAAIASAVSVEVSKEIARAENAFRSQTNAWQAQFDLMGASLGPDLSAAVAKNADTLDRRISAEQTRIDHLNDTVKVLTGNIALLTTEVKRLSVAIARLPTEPAGSVSKPVVDGDSTSPPPEPKPPLAKTGALIVPYGDADGDFFDVKNPTGSAIWVSSPSLAESKYQLPHGAEISYVLCPIEIRKDKFGDVVQKQSC